MISITFSCETQSELHAELVKFVNGLPGSIQLTTSIDPAQLALKFEETTAAMKSEVLQEKAAAKKPKKKAEEKSEEEKAPEVKAAGASGKPASKDEVYAALQGVTTSLGLPVARNILKEFGAEKISDLSFENYRPFIDKCIEMTPV
jgi:hypothetical protein